MDLGLAGATVVVAGGSRGMGLNTVSAEIGPVIAFLGSRVNSDMTGANVNVDGGSDVC